MKTFELIEKGVWRGVGRRDAELANLPLIARLLLHHQSRFRKVHSCQTALIIIYEYIRRMIEDDDVAVLVLIDF